MAPRQIITQAFIFGILSLCGLLEMTESAIEVIDDSREAKTDLKWMKHPANGWEEVSGLDENKKTIRFNQVCKYDEPNQNNWMRSPFFDAQGAKRVYLDVTYSMVKCDTCRETFTLYYYQSNSDVASSTFPPWQQHPYVKIDTVAAGTRFDGASESNGGINHKTFTIGPLRRDGFYIAAQDEGTCMSLIATKLYYYYCPEITYGLANFAKTRPGPEAASLIAVSGKCVSDAVYTNGETPKYRCNSNGEWKVPTGLCQCRAGYYPNAELTACEPCKAGYYKSKSGNEGCQRCPPHSMSHSTGGATCQCLVGYYRAAKDSIDQPCTRPPSTPNAVFFDVNKTTVTVQWSKPLNDGGRSDVYYSATCSVCDSNYGGCQPCPSSVRFTPSDHRHLTGTSVKLQGLELFHYYRIKVASHNGVSSTSNEQANYDIVEFSTIDNVPSAVRGVRMASKSSRALDLSWVSPGQLPDKVTGYEVSVVPVPAEEHSKNNPPKAPIMRKTKTTNITLDGLSPSTSYEIKVRALSPAGPGRYSEVVTFETEPAPPATAAPTQGPDSMGLIIGAVAGAAVVLLVVIVVVVLMRRRRAETMKQQNDRARAKMAGTSDEHQTLTDGSGFTDGLVVRLPPLLAAASGRTTYTDYRDPHKGVKEIAREIEFTSIKIDQVIGQGEFGEVCKGKLLEGKKSCFVAVKRLKRGATLIDQTNLLREACTMAQFNDPNILQLKGVVTKTMPIMIISEFMENESLDKFLLANRGQFSVLQLVNMLHGIASGMRYLSDMQYVHRDLAARNILVNSDYVCKVSDFGLSRNLENDPHATYTTQGGKIPIRWTAPECFRYRRFTSSSDVWSYGIVMWEVMSYGEKPYWDMTNEHVTESIEDGFRLPAPQDCPQVLHRLMLDCWSYEPSSRPTFREIYVRMRRFTQQPDVLIDREPITDANSAFLDPDSPTDVGNPALSLEQWLELMKLGAYRQSFLNQGIRKLSEVVNLSPQDIERLGISQNVHRIRLQSGIQTLRRHLSDDHPNGSATLPMHSVHAPPASPAVMLSTVPRGAVGMGPIGAPSNTVSYHQGGALNV